MHPPLIYIYTCLDISKPVHVHTPWIVFSFIGSLFYTMDFPIPHVLWMWLCTIEHFQLLAVNNMLELLRPSRDGSTIRHAKDHHQDWLLVGAGFWRGSRLGVARWVFSGSRVGPWDPHQYQVGQVDLTMRNAQGNKSDASRMTHAWKKPQWNCFFWRSEILFAACSFAQIRHTFHLFCVSPFACFAQLKGWCWDHWPKHAWRR